MRLLILSVLMCLVFGCDESVSSECKYRVGEEVSYMGSKGKLIDGLIKSKMEGCVYEVCLSDKVCVEVCESGIIKREEIRVVNKKYRCQHEEISKFYSEFKLFEGRPRFIPNDRGKISYYVGNVTGDMDEDDVRFSIERMFREWEKALKPIGFEEVMDIEEAEIKLFFGGEDHSHIGCPFNFDGPGGVLAHAFHKARHVLSGHSHFCEDENWGLAHSDRDVDLFQVGVHELGHCLGFDHSEDRESIMYAFYDGSRGMLGEDDYRAVDELYGDLIEEMIRDGDDGVFIDDEVLSPIDCF